MKQHLFTLITAITLSGSLSAQDCGKVTIRNASNTFPEFIISMNGIRPSNKYSHQAVFECLDEQNYRVKVLQAGSRKVLSFNLNSAPNYLSNFVINRDTYGNYSLILESKSLLTGREEPLTNPVVTLPVESPTVGIKQVETQVVTTPTVPSGPQAMDDADFSSRVKSLKKEPVESTKLDMAKTFFGDQNLSSEQVTNVMKVFSVESYRLNFAKFAYHRVIDKNNFYKTYDALSYSSSKREMSDFIKNNQ